MNDQPKSRVRFGVGPVLLLAVLHSTLFLLSYPPAGVWWFAFLAPIPLALAAVLADRGWVVLLSVGVTQACAWLFLQGWMIDVTVPGYFAFVVYLSLYGVFEAEVLRALCRGRRGIPLAIAVPIVLLGIDWLRAYIIFDGYPWYLRAQPLIDFPALAQLARFGGIWLPGFFALVIAGFLAELIRNAVSSREARGTGTAWALGLGLIALGVVLVILTWALTPQRDTQGEAARTILLVQPNLATDNKIGWTYEQQRQDVPAFIELTAEALTAARAQGESVDLIVWPETMLPSVGFETGDEFSEAIERTVDVLGVPMLIGSPAYIGLRTDESGQWIWDAQYNSAYLVGPQGPPHGRVDKIFLTPFGETMPYISKWPWLEEQLLALGARGMTFDLDSGEEIVILELPPTEADPAPLTMAVPICFEDTVAPVVREMVWADGGRAADLLVNISNDGWFGDDDAGRAMHNVCARWRAIENDMWVLRAANTGDSVAIAPDGQIVDRIDSGPRTEGTLIARVQPSRGPPTVYAGVGELLGALCALAMGVCLVVEWWRRRSRRTGSASMETPAQGGAV